MATKTDNSFLGDKVQLRIDHSPWQGGAGQLKVLDVFGGHGLVWHAVSLKKGLPVNRTGIDKRLDLNDFHLHGDNAKVMRGLDLKKFDVIDLDGYGIPFTQLSEVFAAGFKGTVFVTAIQYMHGMLPHQLLSELGFTESFIKKSPTLLSRRGFQYLKQWLALKGVKRLFHRSKNRKHYLVFCISDAAEPGVDCDTPLGETFADRV